MLRSLIDPSHDERFLRTNGSRKSHSFLCNIEEGPVKLILFLANHLTLLSFLALFINSCLFKCQ